MKLTWQTLENLSQKYGDSFYILDVRKFANNYQEFLSYFRSIYPRTNFGYSYKTNYTPKLCQIADSLGAYAEVVSQMEYDLAMRLGVEPSRIIFNGPLKRDRDLKNAILSGSTVNLDSWQEVETLKDLAREFPERNFTVGLRCNFDVGIDRISRFGFDVEGGDLEYAFSTIAQLPNCSVAGLHSHFSTPQRSIESYALRARKMLNLTDFYFPDRPPKFINLGGGFFGKMDEELRQQFDCYIPNYREYAEAIAPEFARHFPPDTGPELIVEPGVALVADVMQFACQVVGTKTVRSRQIALVAGSIHNIKPTLTDKKLAMDVYRHESSDRGGKLTGDIDLVGYTCMEHDCLNKIDRGEIGIGDYVVFNNIGAYTIVFKPPFISPNSPIISYDSTDNSYELSRRRETSEDVFATYVI
jgi:diaminopimelate decarboxylase